MSPANRDGQTVPRPSPPGERPERPRPFTSRAAAGGSDLELSLLAQLRVLGLPEPVTQYRALPPRRWKWDLAYPWAHLLIEVDSTRAKGGPRCPKCGQAFMGRHGRPEGIEGDAEKQSAAAAAGWRTMRVTPGLIESARAGELIEAALHLTLDDPVPPEVIEAAKQAFRCQTRSTP